MCCVQDLTLEQFEPGKGRDVRFGMHARTDDKRVEFPGERAGGTFRRHRPPAFGLVRIGHFAAEADPLQDPEFLSIPGQIVDVLFMGQMAMLIRLIRLPVRK